MDEDRIVTLVTASVNSDGYPEEALWDVSSDRAVGQNALLINVVAPGVVGRWLTPRVVTPDLSDATGKSATESCSHA